MARKSHLGGRQCDFAIESYFDHEVMEALRRILVIPALVVSSWIEQEFAILESFVLELQVD